jgi:hypothetical protein
MRSVSWHHRQQRTSATPRPACERRSVAFQSSIPLSAPWQQKINPRGELACPTLSQPLDAGNEHQRLSAVMARVSRSLLRSPRCAKFALRTAAVAIANPAGRGPSLSPSSVALTTRLLCSDLHDVRVNSHTCASSVFTVLSLISFLS